MRTAATRRISVKNYPYALSFPGSNTNDMSVGTDTYLFERTQAFSVGMWINVKRYLAGSAHIWSEYQSGSPFRGRLIRIDSGVLRFWLINTLNTNELKANYAVPPLNRWIRIVFTYDGSSTAAGVKCYWDGVLQSQVSSTATLSATIVATGVSTKWGGWTGASANQPMFLAKPFVSDHEWTVTEVADDFYDSKFSGVAPVDYYDITEGSGTTVASLGSGAHNGTLGASVTWSSTETPMKARTTIPQNRLGLS